MKTLTRILFAIGLVGAVAVAQAQGFPGGGQGRRGMMMGRGNSPVMLLQRDDVQEDLKLTSEQRSALREYQRTQRDRMREQFEQMRNGGGTPDREAMRAGWEKMQKEAEAEVAKILTPEQQKRLKEISVQLDGNRAVLRADVAKELGLTEAQNTKLKDLRENMEKANQAVMEKARSGELQRDQIRETFEKNNTIMDEEIGKVLTEAQKTKLKEMGGATFVAKDRDR